MRVSSCPALLPSPLTKGACEQSSGLWVVYHGVGLLPLLVEAVEAQLSPKCGLLQHHYTDSLFSWIY